MSSVLNSAGALLARFDASTWAAILGATYVVWCIASYLRIRWEVRGLYTISSVIPMFLMTWRMKIPHIPLIAPARKMTLWSPFDKYETARSDLIAFPEWMTPVPIYSTASPQVSHMICAKSNIFQKTIDTIRYTSPNIFGLQIISTQTGSVHRRHKGVVRGCFNEDIMEASWDRMTNAAKIMLKEEGLEGGGIVRGVRDVMIKTTLLVIGTAGFSVDIPWSIKDTHGPILPFYEALDWVEKNLALLVVLPLWLVKYAPIPYLRRTYKARMSIEKHMKDMIRSRRERLERDRATLGPGEKSDMPTDILGALVASQMETEKEAKLAPDAVDGIVGLKEQEVISNIFIFIIAGHETTGHTLSWVLGSFALYPEWQDKVLAEIEEACGDADPTYRDFNQLPLVLAFVYETLRHHDIAMGQPKVVVEDTIIPYNTWDSTGTVITPHTRLLTKGSLIMLDTPASQINPYFWPNAQGFDPTRHLAVNDAGKTYVYSASPQSPFMGFSSGQRICIGKRFAEVEMVAFICHIIKRFRIKTVPVKEGESWEEIKTRYARCKEILSLTPYYFEVEFERR